MSAYAFKGSSDLQTLDLSYNLIAEIKDEAFNGLINLNELFLYDNKLCEIKAGEFNGLINLKTLYLNNNQIETCCDQDKLFEGLNKLKGY